MRVWHIVGVLSLSSVLLMSGCFLKKKKPPIPPQAQAPTVEPAPPATAAPAPQPETQPSATTAAPPSTTLPPKETANRPKRKKPAAKKTETAKVTPPAALPPSKVVIREGGASEAPSPQLSANMSARQATGAENQTTAQLIESAEARLRGLNRDLSSGEQAMVSQIRAYIQQSKQATTEGDDLRAHNLALKAHLLSAQLVSH